MDSTLKLNFIDQEVQLYKRELVMQEGVHSQPALVPHRWKKKWTLLLTFNQRDKWVWELNTSTILLFQQFSSLSSFS